MYLKNIARVYKVDIMFCTSETFHALHSAIQAVTIHSGNNVLSALRLRSKAKNIFFKQNGGGGACTPYAPLDPRLLRTEF